MHAYIYTLLLPFPMEGSTFLENNMTDKACLIFSQNLLTLTQTIVCGNINNNIIYYINYEIVLVYQINGGSRHSNPSLCFRSWETSKQTMVNCVVPNLSFEES